MSSANPITLCVHCLGVRSLVNAQWVYDKLNDRSSNGWKLVPQHQDCSFDALFIMSVERGDY